MRFDDFTDSDPELQERLSSWRRVSGVIEPALRSTGESSLNEAEARLRQQRIATMCLNTVKAHDAFVAELKAFIAKSNTRDPLHQQRVEDEATFALGIFEQTSALALEQGIKHELNNLPKEIVETVSVQPPTPQKSWFQRLLGS